MDARWCVLGMMVARERTNGCSRDASLASGTEGGVDYITVPPLDMLSWLKCVLPTLSSSVVALFPLRLH